MSQHWSDALIAQYRAEIRSLEQEARLFRLYTEVVAKIAPARIFSEIESEFQRRKQEL